MTGSRRESRLSNACALNHIIATLVGTSLVLLGLGGLLFEDSSRIYWVAIAMLGGIVLWAGLRTGVYLSPDGVVFRGWWRNRVVDLTSCNPSFSAVPYYGYLNWGMESATFAMIEVRSGERTMRFQFTIGGTLRVRKTAELLRNHALAISKQQSGGC